MLTLVLGVKSNWKLTQQFLANVRIYFPDIAITVGALGCDADTEKFLRGVLATDKNLKVAFGEGEYCFSENYNAAINLVETDKMVLVHNDMYLSRGFVAEIERALETVGEGNLVVYTTVEPSKNIGFIRPGKIIRDFEPFKASEFEKFVLQVQAKSVRSATKPAYGFFLAGRTKVFREVGGYDPRYKPAFCEDDDLTIRLRLAGHKIFEAPRAVCYHFGSQTSRDEFQQGMSELEVFSNRKFCRKWGIEARYLWTSGLLLENISQISILDLKTYLVPEGLSEGQILNLEPLFDYIAGPVPNRIKEYAEKEGIALEEILPKWQGDLGREPDAIFTCSSVDMHVLPKYVGMLRLPQSTLQVIEPGTYSLGKGMRLEVPKSLVSIPVRQISENYLSQTNIQGNG